MESKRRGGSANSDLVQRMAEDRAKLDRARSRIVELDIDIQKSLLDLQRFQEVIIRERSSSLPDNSGRDNLAAAIREFKKESDFLGYLAQRKEQYWALIGLVDGRLSGLEKICGSIPITEEYLGAGSLSKVSGEDVIAIIKAIREDMGLVRQTQENAEQLAARRLGHPQGPCSE